MQSQVIYSYGNDKRQKYLGNMLAEYGFKVLDVPGPRENGSQNSLPLEQCEDISGNEILLLPVVASKETLAGIIPFIHPEHTL